MSACSDRRRQESCAFVTVQTDTQLTSAQRDQSPAPPGTQNKAAPKTLVFLFFIKINADLIHLCSKQAFNIFLIFLLQFWQLIAPYLFFLCILSFFSKYFRRSGIKWKGFYWVCSTCCPDLFHQNKTLAHFLPCLRNKLKLWNWVSCKIKAHHFLYEYQSLYETARKATTHTKQLGDPLLGCDPPIEKRCVGSWIGRYGSALGAATFDFSIFKDPVQTLCPVAVCRCALAGNRSWRSTRPGGVWRRRWRPTAWRGQPKTLGQCWRGRRPDRCDLGDTVCPFDLQQGQKITKSSPLHCNLVLFEAVASFQLQHLQSVSLKNICRLLSVDAVVTRFVFADCLFLLCNSCSFNLLFGLFKALKIYMEVAVWFHLWNLLRVTFNSWPYWGSKARKIKEQKTFVLHIYGISSCHLKRPTRIISTTLYS